MENKKLDNIIKLCTDISADTKKDATDFDGQPFTGRTVGTYFGYHGAAIAALSDVIKAIAEDMKASNSGNTSDFPPVGHM